MGKIKSKRLLIFTSEFPPQPGGIGNHAWNLARELHSRGAIVRVMVEGREGGVHAESEFDDAAPFEVLRIPFSAVGVRQLRRILLYVNLLWRWNPDFIIASGRFPLLLTAGIPARRAVTVAVLHGTEAGATGSLARKAALAAVSRYSTAIAVSKFTRDYFELPADDQRVAVIPNGVSDDRFDGLEIGDCVYAGSPVLTTVGNVTARKGQDNVIRALPAVLERYPDVVYHMAGIPTERQEFSRLAHQLGVREHVVFHGAVSEQELFKLLSSTDVFMMLSSTTATGDVEGFGIAILEANLLGVPAVGALNCGIEDAIAHAATGLLVAPDHPGGVAEAVHRIMESRSSFSQNARSWALQHSWKAIGDRYESVLNGGAARELR